MGAVGVLRIDGRDCERVAVESQRRAEKITFGGIVCFQSRDLFPNQPVEFVHDDFSGKIGVFRVAGDPDEEESVIRGNGVSAHGLAGIGGDHRDLLAGNVPDRGRIFVERKRIFHRTVRRSVEDRVFCDDQTVLACAGNGVCCGRDLQNVLYWSVCRVSNVLKPRGHRVEGSSFRDFGLDAVLELVKTQDEFISGDPHDGCGDLGRRGCGEAVGVELAGVGEFSRDGGLADGVRRGGLCGVCGVLRNGGECQFHAGRRSGFF